MELNGAGFANEKEALSSIDSVLTEKLNSIQETVSGMSSYWHDSKSDQLISDVTMMLNDLNTQKTNAIESGKAMLDGVVSILNSMYR